MALRTSRYNSPMSYSRWSKSGLTALFPFATGQRTGPYRTLSSLAHPHPISLPEAASLNLPSFLSDVWESILRAVPKKKTSHMKKRHRQMAGKALKDVKSINTCPGCGRPKRAHVLCSYCVNDIKERWRQALKE